MSATALYIASALILGVDKFLGPSDDEVGYADGGPPLGPVASIVVVVVLVAISVYVFWWAMNSKD